MIVPLAAGMLPPAAAAKTVPKPVATTIMVGPTINIFLERVTSELSFTIFSFEMVFYIGSLTLPASGANLLR